MTRRDTRRRFEQWAKNPECEANLVSAVAGIEMSKVAVAEGLTPTMGQSPFAISRGQTFERELLKDDAASLMEALIEAKVVAPGSSGFQDLRIRMNSGPVPTLDLALDKTNKMLRAAATAGPAGISRETPTVVASATLKIPGQPVMLPDGILAIDALVLRAAEQGDQVELIVGEVKSYPYRAGSTDTTELATSRAQAGLYHHALSLAVDDLGLSGNLVVAPRGVLILSRHGSNRPQILATEDLEYQSVRAEAGFRRLREAALTLESFDALDEAASIEKVQSSQTSYRPQCLGFCDRAERCRKEGEACGDSNVLGGDVARFLAGVGLDRALSLMEGETPVNDVEKDLVERINAAQASEASAV